MAGNLLPVWYHEIDGELWILPFHLGDTIRWLSSCRASWNL